jgi:hypothetical protein
MIDDTRARKLVEELFKTVDGGCHYCTSDAVEALKVVFPEVNWDEHWEAVQKVGNEIYRL